MRNGLGNCQTSPSELTAPSAIASKRADWVRRPVRFNSSAITMLAKIGPCKKLNVCLLESKTEEPVMSPGSRSGVNWMRENFPSMEPAMGLGQKGFSHPRQVFQEHMPLGEQPQQRQLYLLGRDDHNAPDLFEQAVEVLLELGAYVGDWGDWIIGLGDIR